MPVSPLHYETKTQNNILSIKPPARNVKDSRIGAKTEAQFANPPYGFIRAKQNVNGKYCSVVISSDILYALPVNSIR